MKKIAMTAVLSLLLCGCGTGLFSSGKTVGKQVKETEIREFYFTRSGSTNPPEFQRYRLYTENGAHWFYHETREGDHWPLTESDITVSGKKQLSEEEWKTFYSLLEGGTVRNRSENLDSGGDGPWLYLYWNGDHDKTQEYSFASYGNERAFEEACQKMKTEMTEN